MLIQKGRRGLLYISGAFLILFGIAGLYAPAALAGKLGLTPTSPSGLSELRTLYGGGFAGFGITILAGLRHRAAGRGLLLGMGIIFACLTIGRLVSAAAGHDTLALKAAATEVIMALLCYTESRRAQARA